MADPTDYDSHDGTPTGLQHAAWATTSPSTTAAISTTSPTAATPATTGLPGATVYRPDEVPDGSLNPRSCVICRKRKVKCDHLQPCTNCRRARIACVFPAPGRAPRRPRPKDPNATPATSGKAHGTTEREVELMKRLRKLEGIVEELSGQIELETARHPSSSAGHSPETVIQDANGGRASISDTQAGWTSNNTQSDSHDPRRSLGSPAVASTSNHAQRSPQPTTAEVGNKFGRLVLHDKGKSRYISSGFWSRINDEINQLRAETEEMLVTDSDASEADDSPRSHEGVPCDFPNTASIFGHSVLDVSLRQYHPHPSQIPFIWQIYEENIQPLTKLVHSPTTAAMLHKSRTKLDSLEPPMEALMFAIYLGAITTMEDSDVQTHFSLSRTHLITRYRYALEMALAKAEFLTSTDLTTFQALVIYIMLSRTRENSRYAWTMTGLAIRIGQSLGLQRDPDNFPDLSPFESEMRRRLFWYLALLDLRAAEDQGTDVAISETSYDTRIPSNLNDSDFGPDSKELPPPREGETEMTFVLMSYNVQPSARRLLVLSSAAASMCPRLVDSKEEREGLLREICAVAERICPSDGPTPTTALSFVAAVVARLLLAKMTLLMYRPHLGGSGPGENGGPSPAELGADHKDRLLVTAIEVYEYRNLLRSDPRMRRWRWISDIFMQWHAAAYLLLAISGTPWSPMSERGWTALSTMFSNQATATELDRIADNAAVWVPFKRLYGRARRHRTAEIARLQANPSAAQEMDRQWVPMTLPSGTFGSLSGRIKTKLALDRWRQVVMAPPLSPEAEAQLQREWYKPGVPSAVSTSLPMAATPTPTPIAPQEVCATGIGAAAEAVAASAASVSTENDAMRIMDQFMAQPTFASHDLWPLAFSGVTASTVDAPAYNLTSGPAVLPTSQPCGPVSDTPLVDAIRDYPPPWMWPQTNDATTIPTSQGNSQPSQVANPAVGSLTIDDFDMNMEDDDFNWQVFNENIRGYSAAGWPLS